MYALVVLGVTVVGFVAVSAVGWSPAWAALGGVLALGVPAVRARRTALPGSVRTALAAANLGFAAFVFALGVLVDAVTRHGLGRALGRPHARRATGCSRCWPWRSWPPRCRTS